MTGRAMRAVLVATLLALGLAGAAHADAPAQGCPAPSRLEPGAQKLEVEAVLAPVVAAFDRRLDQLAAGDDAGREAAQDAYAMGRRQAIEPLAEAGNLEAMLRLADSLRESDAAEEVRRWLRLTSCAAAAGSGLADDELVRWWWHQRGDGSLAAVQKNRARALDYARQGADAGDLQAISRIATYISGRVHQYPGSAAIGGEVFGLCASAGDAFCQERLVEGGSYDYGVPPAQAYLWLARLAAKDPARFAARRDAALQRLPQGDRDAAVRAAQDWRPTAWPQLRSHWLELESGILRQGAQDVGPETSCTTSTPWCRGAFIDP